MLGSNPSSVRLCCVTLDKVIQPEKSDSLGVSCQGLWFPCPASSPSRTTLMYLVIHSTVLPDRAQPLQVRPEPTNRSASSLNSLNSSQPACPDHALP